MNPVGKNKRRLDVKSRAERREAVSSSGEGPLQTGRVKAGVSNGEVGFETEVPEVGV